METRAPEPPAPRQATHKIMRAQFSSLGLHKIAEAHIDEGQVHGRGGAVAPLLAVPLRLDLSHGPLGPREGVQFVSMHGRIWIEGTLLSNSQHESINITLQKRFSQLKDRLHYLEFPLDMNRVEALERKRNGGELKLRLEVNLLTNRLFALNDIQDPRKLAQAVWGHVEAQSLVLQAELSIPRDAWISRVLPQVGYGVVHILEFPAAPLEACASSAHAFEALKQALEFHKTGLYDDAVGKCRVALDQFFEYEEKPDGSKDADKVVLRRIPKLKKDWKTVLGGATYVWLEDAMRAIKGASNRAHHSPNAHYCQADSQMIIAITTALVAYAARAQPR